MMNAKQAYDDPVLQLAQEYSEIVLKNFHVERVFETYRFLNSVFSLSEVEAVFENVEKKLKTENTPEKPFRLIFTENIQNYRLEPAKLDPLPLPVQLAVVTSEEPTLTEHRFKFSDRSRWDALLKKLPEGAHDVLLVKKDKAVETSRFNLFLHVEGARLVLTPPLSSGCLSGVFRKSLLQKKSVVLPDGQAVPVIEKDFSIADIDKNKLFVGNSVRGLLAAGLFKIN